MKSKRHLAHETLASSSEGCFMRMLCGHLKHRYADALWAFEASNGNLKERSRRLLYADVLWASEASNANLKEH